MSRVSILLSPKLSYPASADLSPHERYPEYAFPDLAIEKNPIYEGVRELLRMSEVDHADYGSPQWNPLGRWIGRGDRIFVMPNFVTNRQPAESTDDFLAKCTHASVLRAVTDYALIATGEIGTISFGNAPLQSCDYECVLEETGARALMDFYQNSLNRPPEACDLRGVISCWSRFGTLRSTMTTAAETVEVDLGKDSLLDQLDCTSGNPQFRVGDYNPALTESFHGSGRHVYVLNKRILESSVLISVPKLKTHQKVALTCALKGTVGAIARKECLAHHRKGGPKEGGDEYATSHWSKRLASELCDEAALRGESFLANSLRVLSKTLVRACSLAPAGLSSGAWYGNDTAWRMALDIARIIRYARTDGSMSKEPQRRHLALVDGIIAGEGEGPLRPSPRYIGALLFSHDVASVDYASALLMGFDPARIPLVHHAFDRMRYPVSETPSASVELVVNDHSISASELRRLLPQPFRPPKGWVNYLGQGPAAVISPEIQAHHAY
jgi:uncharacterized protein (DUF362 family)